MVARAPTAAPGELGEYRFDGALERAGLGVGFGTRPALPREGARRILAGQTMVEKPRRREIAAPPPSGMLGDCYL